MATRTNDLTEFAKPIADDLIARSGSLKRILSAGVLALKDLTPERREVYMARAIGKELADEPQQREPDISISDSIEIVKHFMLYKIPSKEEQQLFDSLRNILEPKLTKQSKKRKHG